ncbi:MAG: translation initiation factor IF-3 [Candidatus Jidaibacter sp.]|jgi:translation initiation factor IF-3|nr:translation initiation factor IF-3 [Candidatus Jidaibacter sp.]
MIGVMPTIQALKLAAEKGLDLVEISPTAKPPVCKIMNYGKYKYELQKKAQAAKKKQKIVETKEIKVRPTIAEGDLQIKLRNAIKFLEDGNKVRFSLQFKGREITHNEVGFAIIERIKSELIDIARIEFEPKMEGRQIFMIVAPK